MKQSEKGYWVYSIVTVIVCIGMFGFFGYLIYDLIIKLSAKDFSNNTVIQALITLIITVFIGGYFSKWLELRNAKKLELYKLRSDISLRIIDLASAFIYNPEDSTIRNLLIAESSKVKLYFSDDVLKILNKYIQSENKINIYDELVDELKKDLK